MLYTLNLFSAVCHLNKTGKTNLDMCVFRQYKGIQEQIKIMW